MSKKKTVELKIRVDARQAEWLRKRAQRDHDGNVSEAVRQAVTDAWFLEAARADYRRLRDEHGFRLPLLDGEPSGLYVALAMPVLGSSWDDGDEQL